MSRKCLILLLLCATLAIAPGCDKAQNETAEQPAGTIQEKTSGESIAVEVNSPAPAFAARLMGGGEARLSDYVGKVVLLEFWSVFCKSCLQEMPYVKEMHKKYKDRGFEVLSVNTDAFSDSRVLKVLEKAGMVFDYKVIRDVRKEVSVAYNVEILPVTVIIDRSGWIRLYQEGYRPGDEERFEKTVLKYLDATGKEDVTLAPRGGVTQFAPAGAKAPREAEAGGKSAAVKRRALNGEEVTIGGGSPSLLFFWSLYCQPCRTELPEVERLRAAHGGEVRFITVNVDSESLGERVSRFMQPYPALATVNDAQGSDPEMLSDLYGVSATPTVVMVGGKGELLWKLSGATPGGDLEAKIKAVLRR